MIARAERYAVINVGTDRSRLGLPYRQSPASVVLLPRDVLTVTAERPCEAGCKATVVECCKHSGMRWTVSGANAILALRSCAVSGRYEDYGERRAAAAGILKCNAVDRATEGREAAS